MPRIDSRTNLGVVFSIIYWTKNIRAVTRSHFLKLKAVAASSRFMVSPISPLR